MMADTTTDVRRACNKALGQFFDMYKKHAMKSDEKLSLLQYIGDARHDRCLAGDRAAFTPADRPIMGHEEYTCYNNFKGFLRARGASEDRLHLEYDACVAGGGVAPAQTPARAPQATGKTPPR